MTSAVLIIPAALRDAANAVGEAMGWGPKNYTISLSNDGATVTHYACRTDVYVSFFVALLVAEYDLTRAGMTQDEIAEIAETLDKMPQKPVIPENAATVLNALEIDLSQTLWGIDHMQSAMNARNLETRKETE